MKNSHYVFRKPRTIEELRALLQLRYDVYRGSRLTDFVRENSLHLDLDGYDLYAMHFGLFRCDAGTEEPVGYMRLVTDSRQPCADDMIAIASQNQQALHRILRRQEVPYPVMAYATAAEQIGRLHAELRSRGEQLVEPGRFALDSSIRSRAIAQHMVAATFAVTIAMGIDNAILSCTANHSWIYKHFGFKVFPGTSFFLCEQAGNNLSLLLLLLLGVRAGLSEAEHKKVMTMAETYRKTGAICYNPLSPGAYIPPAECGHKSNGTDYVCSSEQRIQQFAA